MSPFIPTYDLPAANHRIVMAERPAGTPAPADFARDEVAIPPLAEGKFLVRNLYLSVDPVQRGWASNPALVSIGDPMRSLAVGVVVDSRDQAIAAGDLVYGFFGWQDYALASQAALLSHIREPRVAASAYAGVLGMPGVTAWLALLDLAPPSKGDPVLVSTAAGAVGSVVGQIARERGAFVVGLTGSDEKVQRATSRFGYDVAINYKTVDIAKTLAETCPSGFRIYFDNTGGDILDIAIRAMAKNGRIIQCGTAATPSWSPPPMGLRNEREILMRVLTWSGFFIFDHVARFGEAIDNLTEMMLAGRLAHDEDIDSGLDSAPAALASLFSGDNAGKKLVYIGNG